MPSRQSKRGTAVADRSKLKQSAYTVLFLLWATYLIAKGINVGDGSQTRDAAEATYFTGGAIVAAFALLPRRGSSS